MRPLKSRPTLPFSSARSAETNPSAPMARDTFNTSRLDALFSGQVGNNANGAVGSRTSLSSFMLITSGKTIARVDRWRHSVETESRRARVMRSFVILDDKGAHALGAAAVMRVHQRGRRDLRRAGGPVHAPAVDHRMNALTLDRQRHGHAVVAMRALIAARRQRIDGGVDGGNGVGTRREGSRRKLHRVPRGIDARRTAPDFLAVAVDFRGGPRRGLDHGLSRQRCTQPLEGQQRFVGDGEEQAVPAAREMQSFAPSRKAEYVAAHPADDVFAVAALAATRQDIVDFTRRAK